MDEQGKKINLGSFFGRSSSLDKLSSAAFSKSNPTMTAVGDNKLLIESLQSSIETIQSQIQNIANYLIVENKIQTDVEKDRIFQEEDAKQKQDMRDRALGLQSIKGDRGSQGPKGEFGQQGGGGSFLGGLLKALAIGGTLIASVKLLGPVLLPMLTKGIFTKLIPALGKGISLGFGKLGGVIAKGLTGTLGKLPLVGKSIVGLGSKLISGITSVGTKIVGSIAAAIGLGGLAGGSVKASESNMSFASGDSSSDEGLVEGGKDKTEVVEKRSYGNRILGGIDAMSGNLLDLDKKGGETFGRGRVLGGILDAVTFNKFDFDRKNSVEANDLTFKDINQLKSSVANNSAAIQTITTADSQNVGRANSPVTVQNSKPQVTYTEIKTTKPAIPFINTLGNQYLSLSPHTNKLPPEIARMIQ
tara:strand:- start:18 stop:1265 length:1248 start_codon:yes stop_codon:yes gene_type:complete